MSDIKKPEGLDSGIALSEWREQQGAKLAETPAGRMQAQMLLHEMVMTGTIDIEQAALLGYAGAAKPDAFYSMLLTLRDTVAQELGYNGYISREETKQLAVALVEIGWTPPVSIEGKP